MSPKYSKKKMEDILKTDFSAESVNKDKIYHQLMAQIEHAQTNDLSHQQNQYVKEHSIMIKKRFKHPIAMVAVITTLVMAFSITAYAIVNQIMVGKHAIYYTDLDEPKDIPIPEELAGKLYDEKGNELALLSDAGDNYYNADGEIVVIEQDDNGGYELKTAAEYQAEHEAWYAQVHTTVYDIKEVQPYLAFELSMPESLPQGYSVDRYELFNGDDGKPVKNCEYLEAFLSNGDKDQEIYLQARLMNEETAYSAGGRTLEKIMINGHEAVIDDRSLDIQVGDVMYMFIAKQASSISQDELIKMAESIQ